MNKPILSSLALVVLLGPACFDKQVQSFSPAHDQESLAKAAELFWHDLRWSEYEGASLLIEDPATRLDFLTRWSTEPPVQITDYKLVHVELREPGADAEHIEGRVVVRVEGISTGRFTLELEMIDQSWYRDAEQWYLDPTDLPFEPSTSP